MSGHRSRVKRASTAALVTTLGLLLATVGPAHAAAGSRSDTTTWHLMGETTINGLTQGQGLTTVRPRGTESFLYFTGDLTPPQQLKDEGWTHDGDPDSSRGYVFEAYQNSTGAPTKMFYVTTPNGQHYEYVHDLIGDELENNSFAAITPNGQWMVSGEWGTMNRFLVFPTPILNQGTPREGGALPLASVIHTDRPVTDIQGCTFMTATQLICSSDDPIPENGIPRKALLQVDLPRPLVGFDTSAHVTPLFSLPEESSCPRTGTGSWPEDYEVEGLDYDRLARILRVEVIPPGACGLNSTLYEYKPPGVAEQS